VSFLPLWEVVVNDRKVFRVETDTKAEAKEIVINTPDEDLDGSRIEYDIESVCLLSQPRGGTKNG